MENMTIEEVCYQIKLLNEELQQAVSNMDKKNTIKEIRAKLIALQEQCPHNVANGICLYCGKRL